MDDSERAIACSQTPQLPPSITKTSVIVRTCACLNAVSLLIVKMIEPSTHSLAVLPVFFYKTYFLDRPVLAMALLQLGSCIAYIKLYDLNRTALLAVNSIPTRIIIITCSWMCVRVPLVVRSFGWVASRTCCLLLFVWGSPPLLWFSLMAYIHVYCPLHCACWSPHCPAWAWAWGSANCSAHCLAHWTSHLPSFLRPC